MKQYGALDDVFYLWFAANTTSGSGGDGATPAADVRLAGAAADAAPVYSPTPVLLSHVNYPAGAYEIAIAATAANGFAANNVYAVFCTLAIDAQNPTGFVGGFDLKSVKATLDGEKVALSDSTETQIDAVETDVELIKGIGFPEVKKLELAAGENGAEGINRYGDYLYAVMQTSPGKVVKVALPDFRKIGTLTFNVGENNPWCEIPIIGHYLYSVCDSGHLVKIDLDTFTEVDSITLSVSALGVFSSDEGGNYLYAVNDASPSVVVKIDIATFTEVDSLTLDSGENSALASFVKESKLYIGLNISPGKIVKVDLDSFTRETTLTLSSGNNGVSALTGNTSHLYAGLNTDPGRIVEIDTPSFTEKITLVLETGESQIYSLGIDETYLYLATNNNPTKIITIDLDAFIRLSTWTAEAGYSSPGRNLLLYRNIIYATCTSTPAKLLGAPLSIWQHANQMQEKLPTNNIMGSSVKTDKDDEIDDIKNAVIIKEATINDATPTTTKFITTLTETASTFWPRAALLIISGQNKGQIRGIKTYNGSTKEVQLQTPLSYAPADGDAFWIIPARKFLMPDIENVAQASVCTEARLAQLDEANIPADIDSVVAAVVGVGALSCTWTQKDEGGVPMDNVQVWICTDEAGSNVIAGTLLTDANGEVTFMLDAGTYYVFRERAGYNFTNPKEWSVS